MRRAPLRPPQVRVRADLQQAADLPRLRLAATAAAAAASAAAHLRRQLQVPAGATAVLRGGARSAAEILRLVQAAARLARRREAARPLALGRRAVAAARPLRGPEPQVCPGGVRRRPRRDGAHAADARAAGAPRSERLLPGGGHQMVRRLLRQPVPALLVAVAGAGAHRLVFEDAQAQLNSRRRSVRRRLHAGARARLGGAERLRRLPGVHVLVGRPLVQRVPGGEGVATEIGDVLRLPSGARALRRLRPTAASPLTRHLHHLRASTPRPTAAAAPCARRGTS